MTKAKAKETETVDGSGASAGLVLVRKKSASGYYGVRPNGKKGWQARVYKPKKQCWDDVGTYETPREAAIQAAIAQKQVKNGFGSLYSPLKPRPKTGTPLTSCPPCPLRAALLQRVAERCESRTSEGPQVPPAHFYVPFGDTGEARPATRASPAQLRGVGASDCDTLTRTHI